MLIDGVQGSDLRPGQTLLTVSHTWQAFGAAVRIGLDPGARIRNESDGSHIQLRILTGHVTVAAQLGGVTLVGEGWSAVVAPGSAPLTGCVAGAGTTRGELFAVSVWLPPPDCTTMLPSIAWTTACASVTVTVPGAGATGDPAGATQPVGNVINPGVTQR